MARTAVIQRELKRELCVLKHAKKRHELKEALRNAWHQRDAKKSILLQRELNDMTRDSNPCRQRRRCRRTGRSHGNYRLVGMCRNEIYKMVGFGLLPGIKGESW